MAGLDWAGLLTLFVPSAQKVPVTLALNNTLFLSGETEYIPWQAALSSLSYFQLMFDRTEVYGPMQVSGGRGAALQWWQGSWCKSCRGGGTTLRPLLRAAWLMVEGQEGQRAGGRGLQKGRRGGRDEGRGVRRGGHRRSAGRWGMSTFRRHRTWAGLGRWPGLLLLWPWAPSSAQSSPWEVRPR